MMRIRAHPQPPSQTGRSVGRALLHHDAAEEDPMTDDAHRGITLEDLPGIYREGYLYSLEMARALHDPATDWEGFRDYLWQSLIRVFGLDVDVEWPSDVPGAEPGPLGSTT